MQLRGFHAAACTAALIATCGCSTTTTEISPAQLPALAESHDVLRVKGFAAVAKKPLRLLVQAVGARVTHQYDRPWGAREARDGRLVVIGPKGIDRDGIAAMLLA